ncbi:glycosyltransferase family 2 protein [Clostridium sp. DL1XJH146]
MIENKLKTVSIIVPCRNEKKYISQCIESFIHQSYNNYYYEVLVCDGMSDDGTRDIIKEYEKKYDNIRLLDNPGITAPKGMNVGIKNSNADIIIIFGAHAYADTYFIENNVKALNKEANIGCVGGPIETINENKVGKAIALAMSSPFGVGNALFRYSKKEIYVDTVAFGAYKRTVLDKIGYFDEELVRNQDDEMNFRVTKAGYEILLSPTIKSKYFSRGSLKKLWTQYFQYGFWKVRVMQKHGKTASIRHLVPLLFVSVNILGAILSLFSTVVFYLWLTEIASYIMLDLFFSYKQSKENKDVFGSIFKIFPILHISYGLGFIEGLFSFYIFKSKNNIGKNTKLSR